MTVRISRTFGAPALALAIVFIGLLATTLARETPLIEAVKRGETAAVTSLLARKVPVGEAEADGTTALHWAVHRDDRAMVEQLLRAGADARAVTRYGVTPLHLAAPNGSAAVIERLLDAGADPNTALPDGETTLMTAARAGRVDAVKMLIARGAAVSAREPAKGQTALMWAAADNNAAVVRALIEAGADIRERSKSGAFTPYLFAIRAGHIETARALIDAGANVDETMPDGTSALVLAVVNAHYELAGMLLEKGANPNADAQGWTALHQIAWSRRHNAGFNLPGPVSTGNLDSLELARLLVKRGADVNARQKKEPRDGNRNLLNRIGATPFVLAAKSADVPLMRTLLDLGADASIPTTNGTTALMAAAGVGIWAPGENPGTHEESLAAVKLALSAGGGQVNDIDSQGETALHGAVYRGGNITVMQFLIERGARLDVRNKKGWTPLTAADGVEYTPAVLKRYPEAAALLRAELKKRGLPVPADSQPGSPAPAPASAAERTVWDGVFTAAQAERGQQVYDQACASCHQKDLLGERDAPALVGESFSGRWNGTTTDDMLQTIRRTMPQEAPDSLGTQGYVDIISYLLKVSGSPAGTTELPTDSQALQQIRVTTRAASR